MKTKIYTVYDSKAEAYLQPFYYASQGNAIRAFMEAAKDEKSNISKYKEDFCLFEIGEYDDSNASIKMHEVKQNLGLASELA